MTTRARIQAFKEALDGQGVTEIRMQLTTEQVLELVPELSGASDQVKAAAGSVAELLALPAPTGLDESMRRSAALQLAVSALWEIFEGTDCDGVTLIRKR